MSECKVNIAGEELSLADVKSRMQTDPEFRDTFDKVLEDLGLVSNDDDLLSGISYINTYEKIKTKQHTQLKELRKNTYKFEEALRVESITNDTEIDQVKLKKIRQVRQDVTEQLDTIEGDIADLAQTKHVSHIKEHFTRDLDRASTLLDTVGKSISEGTASRSDYEYMEEAKKLVKLFAKSATFDSSNNLYNPEDIQAILDKALDDPTNSVIKAFEEVARKAAPLLDKITNMEQGLVEAVANNDPFLKDSIFKMNDGDEIKHDYNSLLFTKDGLSDLNFMEALTMDITNGIANNNGLVTQVMQTKADATIEKHKAQANKFISKLDALTLDTEKVLLSKGIVTNGKGLLGNAKDFPDWSIFHRKTSAGKLTSEIIDKFTVEYERFLDDSFDSYNQDVRVINKSTERPSAKNAQRISARVTADNKLKQKVNLLDINSIPELRTEFPELFTSEVDNDKLSEYKKALGDKHYQKIVKQQSAKIRQFVSDRDTYFDKIDNDPSLDDGQKDERKKNWDLRFNPVHNTKKFDDFAGTRDQFITGSGYAYARESRYDVYVPKSTSTEFIDQRFLQIESDDTLYKFHSTIKDEIDENYSNFSSDLQSQYGNNYMALVEKSVKEIMLDPDLLFLAKISAVFQKLMKDLTSAFSFKAADTLAYSKKDPITGERNYRISENFIRMNDDTLQARMALDKGRLKLAFDEKFDTINGVLTVTDFNTLTPDQINLLADMLEIRGKDKIAQIKSKFRVSSSLEGNPRSFINMHRVVKDNAVHESAKKMSMDLPKTMKVFSRAARVNAARQEMLPELKILKKHYELMQKPRLNNADEAVDETDELLEKERRLDPNAPVSEATPGLDGLRTNSIAQMESWFDRVVLGNVGTSHSSVTRILRPMIEKHVSKSTAKNIMNRGEKGVANLNFSKEHIKLSEMIKDMQEDLAKRSDDKMTGENDSEIEKYDQLINKLKESEQAYEKHFSITSMVEGFLAIFRLKSLGWNIGSAFTNHVEGQLSNELLADAGDFFSQESFTKAKHYTMRNRYKTLAFGKYKDDHTEKVSFIMKNYDILQDSANELQKASISSSNHIGNKIADNIGPYAMTTRVEFGNQAPLAVAILLERNITGKDGTVSSVYDALELNPETGNIELSDNFSTEQNKNNWIDGNGEDFINYKAKVGKAIDTAHGNYSETRGMMIKDTTAGKSVMSFKSWITRMIYDRFASEQLDVQMNGTVPFKGRYLSVTKAVGMVGGAIIAAPMFGFPGLLIGGALGTAAGRYNQRKIKGENRLETDLGFAEELKITTKALVRKLIANKANFVTGFFSDQQAVQKFNDEELSKMLSDNFNERDLANLKKNITEMAFVVQQMLTVILAKSMLAEMFEECDSDDLQCKKDNEDRKLVTNLVTNKSMQFIESSTMFLNPLGLWNSMLGDVPLGRLMEEFGEVTSAVQKAISGDDTITTGINAGESRLGNKFGKLVTPGSFSSVADATGMNSTTNSVLALAFGSASMERQFKETAFDRLGKTKLQLLKKQVKGQRASYRLELEGMGYKKKTIDKMVNDRYPTPKTT